MIYAQINEDNVCIGISQLAGVVEAENMIELAEHDPSILGKKYNKGKWEEVPIDPVTPEPTEMEMLGQQLTDLEILILMGGI